MKPTWLEMQALNCRTFVATFSLSSSTSLFCLHPSLKESPSIRENVIPPKWEWFERSQLNESMSEVGEYFTECHFCLSAVGICPTSPFAFSHQQESWTSIIRRENISASVHKWPTASVDRGRTNRWAFPQVSQTEPTNREPRLS